MTRLPTDGGDSDTWGSVLNDYLTESAFHTALDGDVSSGATTFDVSVAPPGLIVGSVILIDAYTTEAEMKKVTGISSNTITVSATNYSHSSGDTVLVLRDMTVSPLMYGAAASSDNWGPLQRMVIEAQGLAVKCKHTGGLKGDGVFAVSNPICVGGASIWQDFGFSTHSTYAPTDSAGALVMVSARQWAFTATAADDTFTVAGGHGIGTYSETNNTKIVFNTPYGETLPGGLTAGKVYYIDTVPDSTTFTISATKGGSILDVTSDGAGYAWEEIDDLTRVYWDNVRFAVSVADVNGVRLSMQQPSYIRGIRIELSKDCTSRNYCLVVGGQIGYISDAEIDAHGANTTGISMGGTGITFTNLNVGGNHTANNYGIEVACAAGTITNLWTEGPAIGVKIVAECRTFAIDGTWLFTSNYTTPIAIQADTGTAQKTSYRVCPIKMGTGGWQILKDVDKSINLYAAGYTTDKTLVATDMQGTYMGHVQEGQNDSDSAYKPPTLSHRTMISKAADYSLRYIDKGVVMNSSGANRTITLPTAASWIGHEFVIHHVTGSSNTCTLDGSGSETIDGSSTITISSGSSKRIMSNGSNWVSV